MISLEALQSKKEKVCVVGLGYVGLPLAVLLSDYFEVYGYDIHEQKVQELRAGVDRTGELHEGVPPHVRDRFSSDPSVIADSSFIIVAVPTPIDTSNTPDLTILEKASETVGTNLKEGSIVVYESTVYPGATEEVCIPILEKTSGLKAGTDFFVGYSPERVNPGDKEHTIDKIVKVVSGTDAASTDVIAGVYGAITQIHKAKSIKVAEAAKVIENTQRDLNIAFMNELAVLFSKMGISTYDVLEAAKTKWNFLNFTPGLVGGHCIGVDPYYLTFKAQEVGHTPEVILAGRGINSSMHSFVAQQITNKMTDMGKDLGSSNVVILGVTFKENVRDVRNSKVIALYQELKNAGANPVIYDPLADPEEIKNEYGISLSAKDDLPQADTLIAAVAHDEFKAMTPEDIKGLMNSKDLLLVDIKKIYDGEAIQRQGIEYWTF